jgi:hypothetical protein
MAAEKLNPQIFQKKTIIATEQLTGRNFACCYDNSPPETNPTIYVDGTNGNDNYNGRSTTYPVATLTRAVEIVNRIGSWDGTAYIRIMGALATDSTTLTFVRPLVGDTHQVVIMGNNPTTRSYLISNGAVGTTNLTNTAGTDILHTYPAYDTYQLNTTLTVNAEKGKGYYISSTATSSPIIRGVIWDNTAGGLVTVLDSSGIDYTNYYLTIVEPADSITFTEASNTEMEIHSDGMKIAFRDLDITSVYVTMATMTPATKLWFETCAITHSSGNGIVKGRAHFTGCYIGAASLNSFMQDGEELTMYRSMCSYARYFGTNSTMRIYLNDVVGQNAIWTFNTDQVYGENVAFIGSSGDVMNFNDSCNVEMSGLGVSGATLAAPATPSATRCLDVNNGSKFSVSNMELRAGLTAMRVNNATARVRGAAYFLRGTSAAGTAIALTDGANMYITGTSAFETAGPLERYTTNDFTTANGTILQLNGAGGTTTTDQITPDGGAAFAWTALGAAVDVAHGSLVLATW